MSAPLPDPTRPFSEQGDTLLLAQCIFGEARGEIEAAQTGVGWVVQNRLLYHRPEYGDRSYSGVILKPGQFDCFTDEVDQLMNPLKYESDSVWENCFDLASGIIGGIVERNIDACTFYHSIPLDQTTKLPYWAKMPLKIEHYCDLGNLHFYRYREYASSVAEDSMGG